jgi:hypothetical protein
LTEGWEKLIIGKADEKYDEKYPSRDDSKKKEFSLWSIALSADDIQKLYQGYKPTELP